MGDRVGIRQLQQHASSVIARVRAGETIEITQRGHPVATIGPPARSPIEALIDAGLATPATMSIHDLPPLLPARERPLTQVLEEMRDDER